MVVQFNPDAFVEILDRSNYPSRKAFADSVGISPGALADIAKRPTPRRQPSDELIRRLAEELKVPVTAIIHAPADLKASA